jgi:hypothetical protein
MKMYFQVSQYQPRPRGRAGGRGQVLREARKEGGHGGEDAGHQVRELPFVCVVNFLFGRNVVKNKRLRPNELLKLKSRPKLFRKIDSWMQSYQHELQCQQLALWWKMKKS